MALQACCYCWLRGLGFRLHTFGFNQQFPVPGVDLQDVAIANGAIQYGMRNAILDLFLYDTLERTGTKLRIIAQVGQQIFRGITQIECDMALSQAWAQAIDLDIHDVRICSRVDLMENDHLVNAVDEFWSEAFFTQSLPYQCAVSLPRPFHHIRAASDHPRYLS